MGVKVSSKISNLIGVCRLAADVGAPSGLSALTSHSGLNSFFFSERIRKTELCEVFCPSDLLPLTAP